MDTCVKFDIKIVRKQLFPEVILKIKLKKGIYLVSFRVKNKKKRRQKIVDFSFCYFAANLAKNQSLQQRK